VKSGAVKSGAVRSGAVRSGVVNSGRGKVVAGRADLASGASCRGIVVTEFEEEAVRSAGTREMGRRGPALGVLVSMVGLIFFGMGLLLMGLVVMPSGEDGVMEG
jgi:hypothetical protein